MRILFGLVGLVIVLGIVASIGKSQLKALSQLGQTSTRVVTPGGDVGPAGGATGSARDGAATVAVPGGVPGATTATVETTVPMQVQNLQKGVLDRTNAALQQGVQRNQAAQP